MRWCFLTLVACEYTECNGNRSKLKVLEISKLLNCLKNIYSKSNDHLNEVTKIVCRATPVFTSQNLWIRLFYQVGLHNLIRVSTSGLLSFSEFKSYQVSMPLLFFKESQSPFQYFISLSLPFKCLQHANCRIPCNFCSQEMHCEADVFNV